MLALARITLRHHRFEVGASLIALLAIALLALGVTFRLSSLAVSPECYDRFIAGNADAVCDAAFRAFDEVRQGQATPILVAMLVVPLASGLLVGVALVGRELEARTAQTAWSIVPSRRVWLGRQLATIAAVLGTALVFAAVATTLLVAARTIGTAPAFADEGMHGALAIVRGAAALALGLLLGAVVGRTLPAFIIGAAIVTAMFIWLPSARQAWVSMQPLIAFDQEVLSDPHFGGWLSEQAWRSPDGSILTQSEAAALAANAGASDDWLWLTEQGYEVRQFGITAETAAAWEPTQAIALTGAAAVLLITTVAVVDRRRPA